MPHDTPLKLTGAVGRRARLSTATNTSGRSRCALGSAGWPAALRAAATSPARVRCRTARKRQRAREQFLTKAQESVRTWYSGRSQRPPVGATVQSSNSHASATASGVGSSFAGRFSKS